MRNQLRSDHLTEHLSAVHQLTEKLWAPPPRFCSTLALFTRSVISCQPVLLSILVPCFPCSVGLALTSGVVSTLILGCWLWKRSISASGCVRQLEWYVSVAMVTGCLYRMLISNHVLCFDRAVAMGFEEMVSGTLHSCLRNFWRIHLRPLEDKAFCFWWSTELQHPIDVCYTSMLGNTVGYIKKTIITRTRLACKRWLSRHRVTDRNG